MKMYNLLKIILLIIVCFFISLSFVQALSPVAEYQILEEAKFLPFSGVLLDNGDGLVYLKVDDDYIHKLFPLVQETGFKKLPYFRRHDSPGAHISVFYENETKDLGEIKELGQPYLFTIKGVKTVRNRKNSYIVIEVEAPELEELRQSYGFFPKLQGHEFHITIATKQLPKKNK